MGHPAGPGTQTSGHLRARRSSPPRRSRARAARAARRERRGSPPPAVPSATCARLPSRKSHPRSRRLTSPAPKVWALSTCRNMSRRRASSATRPVPKWLRSLLCFANGFGAAGGGGCTGVAIANLNVHACGIGSKDIVSSLVLGLCIGVLALLIQAKDLVFRRLVHAVAAARKTRFAWVLRRPSRPRSTQPRSLRSSPRSAILAA